MKTIEIARRLAQLGATEDACRAYIVALNEGQGKNFTDEMEGAAYLMEFGTGEDYQVAYTYFVGLYNAGMFRDTVLEIIDEAFYTPNVKLQMTRYEKNCKLLSKYPYFFRKKFPKFEDLPIKFYPFDDCGFLPFTRSDGHFGEYINFNNQVVGRNFFKDLDDPVLAADVFSQYELEYLNDNVRPSEYIGRDNHVYLHYTNWYIFCSYLCCLNMRPLLADKKFVFLIEDDIQKYPIDFKKDFGIDYSQYPVKPVGIREVNRIIWHTQLSAHNGGDFFNEIFDAHPNLMAISSMMFDHVKESVDSIHKTLQKAHELNAEIDSDSSWVNKQVLKELSMLKDFTDKDILVTLYMNEMARSSMPINHDSRIAPAIFFQPHFSNIMYELKVEEKTGNTTLYSKQYEEICESPLLRGFKYIKTFTPMRRFTTSYGGTVRFMTRGEVNREADGKRQKGYVPDEVVGRVINRSFMIDWQDRLFKDSILVRFEDGKLNPKATFTALAAFLDLPYTDTMTYCSEYGKRDPVAPGNAVGFDADTVYRSYDEFVCDSERIFIEYFLRDAYEYYGYDFQYYDGSPMDENKLEYIITHCNILDGFIKKSVEDIIRVQREIDSDSDAEKVARTDEIEERLIESLAEEYMKNMLETRRRNANILMRSLKFYNRNGQPLHMMPKLKLDPALLEQPLYH